ncbi:MULTISPECIES: MFS transporter [unclassified Pseudomonas]|uniref:MFS transporter n=1 Tax=unclassified Pseudomonas TaxID=196821 RepID=UPI00119FAC4A|nr:MULTISPECIES: MFS transporter [unclassified Pseudomonas]
MEDLISLPQIKPVARRIIALGILIILLDGFDTQAIGFAASSMSQDLGIAVRHFGVVFSAGLVGALLGAFILSPLADRFGRKPIIEFTVAIFGLFTFATVFATSLEALCLLRFLAGIGLGGTIPNIISHSVEYVPEHRRGFVVGLLYAGFPVGGMLGAGIASLVIPTLGWEALFIIGGILPFVLIPMFHLLVPESVQFLANAPHQIAKLQALLQRLAPALPQTFNATWERPVQKKTAISEVFAAGGFTGSFLIWLPFFMILLLLIVMVLWTPALLKQSGLGASESVLVVGLINLGSALGNVWVGRTIDKFGPFLIIPLVVIGGTICLAPMGALINIPMLLSACAVGSGFFFGAAASGMLTLSASWYPAHVRATGLGWAYSMGRLGQVAGPLLTGGLLSVGLSVQFIFILTAVPAACAALSIMLLRTLPHAANVDKQRQEVMPTPEVH